MEYRRLGETGVKVSAICLGTMQFGWTADEPTSFAIMDKAMELGCNFLDTANVYSRWHKGNQGGESETIIGEWLSKGTVRRQDLILATKVRGAMGPGPNDQGLSRRHILKSIDESLARLQTDYIDLYQVHHPDEETPLEETLETFEDLIRWGKVRYVGCSNFPAWLLAKSLWISDKLGCCRFDTLQPHYNYVHRAEFERELEPLCQDQGIGVIPYSPLGGGFLTGKYRPDEPLPDSQRAPSVKDRYMNARGFAALDALEQVSREHGVTIAQTAIAWTLANPTVSSVIIGANNIEQLSETFKSVELALSWDERKLLGEVTSWR